MVVGSKPAARTKQGNNMDAIAQVSGPLELLPAYGRVYHTKEEALADWMAGRDFKIINGPYCSVRDATNLRLDYSSVWIYWNRVDTVRVM
jgi:hypothetical protein